MRGLHKSSRRCQVYSGNVNIQLLYFQSSTEFQTSLQNFYYNSKTQVLLKVRSHSGLQCNSRWPVRQECGAWPAHAAGRQLVMVTGATSSSGKCGSSFWRPLTLPIIPPSPCTIVSRIHHHLPLNRRTVNYGRCANQWERAVRVATTVPEASPEEFLHVSAVPRRIYPSQALDSVYIHVHSSHLSCAFLGGRVESV